MKTQNLVWKRGVALFYDHMIVAFACVIIILPTLISVAETMHSPEELFTLLLGSIYTIPAVVLMMVFIFLYEPFLTYKYGWTLGKKICGLKVVGNQGQNLTFTISLLRFMAKSFCISVPYANIVILIFCYFRQTKNQKVLWDEWLESNVISST